VKRKKRRRREEYGDEHGQHDRQRVIASAGVNVLTGTIRGKQGTMMREQMDEIPTGLSLEYSAADMCVL
jgi:hypothetical protein